MLFTGGTALQEERGIATTTTETATVTTKERPAAGAVTVVAPGTL